MNIEDIPADTMDTSGATTDAELQVFHPQNTQNCATQRAPAPNDQNGDDGDTRPLLIIDSEGVGATCICACTFLSLYPNPLAVTFTINNQ